MSEALKKRYYLKQNRTIAWVKMVEALGYDTKQSLGGISYSYYQNGKNILPEELPSPDECDEFILNLERGLTVEECQAELLKNYEEATITKTIKYLKRKEESK